MDSWYTIILIIAIILALSYFEDGQFYYMLNILKRASRKKITY